MFRFFIARKKKQEIVKVGEAERATEAGASSK